MLDDTRVKVCEIANIVGILIDTVHRILIGIENEKIVSALPAAVAHTNEQTESLLATFWHILPHFERNV